MPATPGASPIAPGSSSACSSPPPASPSPLSSPSRPGCSAPPSSIGVGTGLITPLAFAALAAASPPERLGQTMGAAEIGRELGDAGGPLLVGGIAAAATLAVGFLGLAGVSALSAAAVAVTRPTCPTPLTLPLFYY